jgi:predicted PurR-regulated permease PerM
MYGNRKVSNFLLAAAIVAGALFLHKYLGVFALAALTTLIFAPLHNWLLKRKVRIAKLATAITIFAIILSLLAPLFTIIGLAYYEANQASSSIKNNELKGANLDKFTATLNDTAHDLGINISHDSISNKIKALSKKAIPGILDFIFNTVGSIAIFVTDVIVYFMLLATMLSRKYQLVDALKRLSPFANSVNNEYLSKVKAMAISMVKGSFIIALIVSLISCLTLWIIGFPYLILWFILFTIMSLIPLGAGIIYVPIGIILLLTGNTWQGILILAVQFIVLNNVDNVLRPLLSPKDSRLPGVLVLVSTFAGVSYFGLLGVVYGPIIMVLIYTTIELYDRHQATGMPLKRAAV